MINSGRWFGGALLLAVGISFDRCASIAWGISHRGVSEAAVWKEVVEVDGDSTLNSRKRLQDDNSQN